jgi:hypothetical protein
MTSIRIACLKEVFYELISFIQTKKSLHMAILNVKRHENKDFCYFSLLEDLKIILFLIESDKDISLHFDRESPILNNSFEHFERPRRPIRKRIGIILNWTQNDFAYILEYLKNNEEIPLIRTKDAIKQISANSKSLEIKNGRKTILQILKEMNGFILTKKKENQNQNDCLPTESKNNGKNSLKRLNYENFRIFERQFKLTQRKSNKDFSHTELNEKILKNQEKLQINKVIIK